MSVQDISDKYSAIPFFINQTACLTVMKLITVKSFFAVLSINRQGMFFAVCSWSQTGIIFEKS